MYENEKRTVLTLDAGGTNFVFSAIRGNEQIVEPVCMPSVSDDLKRCLDTLIAGFDGVVSQLDVSPVAISFAFPGPADYKNGVIGGNIPNFPSFRNGVALGPFLQHHYHVPVFMENDGNLFAYGEALSGMLPKVNAMLEEAGSRRRYKNLLGVTLGTGFGAGVVIDGRLLTGDNGCGGDVWLMHNKKYPLMISEESVSVRAVKRVYRERSGQSDSSLTPKDIYDIAEGTRDGNRDAAVASFSELGEIAGHAVASALNIVDGLVVIGGGLAGASRYILPAMIKELRTSLSMFSGECFPCVQMDVYNWEDESDRKHFLSLQDDETVIPDTTVKVSYNKSKCIAVMCSHDGASVSIMRGAYAYALSQL